MKASDYSFRFIDFISSNEEGILLLLLLPISIGSRHVQTCTFGIILGSSWDIELQLSYHFFDGLPTGLRVLSFWFLTHFAHISSGILSTWSRFYVFLSWFLTHVVQFCSYVITTYSLRITPLMLLSGLFHSIYSLQDDRILIPATKLHLIGFLVMSISCVLLIEMVIRNCIRKNRSWSRSGLLKLSEIFRQLQNLHFGCCTLAAASKLCLSRRRYDGF